MMTRSSLLQENQVIAQADSWMKTIPQMTKREVKALIDSIPKDDKGNMDFHELQE